MIDPTITYFPVGNGDTSLIRLADNTQILIDCRLRKPDPSEYRYPVRDHLLDVAKKDNGTPHVDAFVLTHPDEDHCLGFETTFYCGDPKAYGGPAAREKMIRIDELWFTPRIFEYFGEELCADAKAFQKEVNRRIRLHQTKHADRDLPGNRIRIIGWQHRPGLEDVQTTPGNEVPKINGKVRSDFSFFVHAPFKKDTYHEEIARNNTSLVVQARFHVGHQRFAATAFFGGDAEWTTWANIVELTKNPDDIMWDLFLAPHHCSWTFFNVVPHDANKEPQKSSLAFLSKRRGKAFVVGSAKPIKDDEDNPPHYAAKREYVKVVGLERFLCTSETPSVKKPEPIMFAMTLGGPVLETNKAGSQLASSAAIHAALGTPQTYG